tara:strand:+ start:82 stop:258 length:177 start_codon:yes stop_codon:yes gene_type:complete
MTKANASIKLAMLESGDENLVEVARILTDDQFERFIFLAIKTEAARVALLGGYWYPAC